MRAWLDPFWLLLRVAAGPAVQILPAVSSAGVPGRLLHERTGRSGRHPAAAGVQNAFSVESVLSRQSEKGAPHACVQAARQRFRLMGPGYTSPHCQGGDLCGFTIAPEAGGSLA